LLVALAWVSAGDPNLAGRAQALSDGEALLGAFDVRAESWLQELRAGAELGQGGAVARLRLSEGEVTEPRPLPIGVELRDAPTPQLTPAKGWLRTGQSQRADPAAALASFEQGIAALSEGEVATRARLHLEAALAAGRLDRHPDALAFLRDIQPAEEDLLDGTSLPLIVVHRRLDLLEEMGEADRRAGVAGVHFFALMSPMYAVDPQDLRLEAGLLGTEEELAQRGGEIDGIIRATWAARAWQQQPGAAMVNLGRAPGAERGDVDATELAVLNANSTAASIYAATSLRAALVAAWAELLPAGGAFAVVETDSAEAGTGELVGVPVGPAGLRISAQLRVVDFRSFTTAQVQRQAILLGAAAVLAAALVALAWFGRRLLIRQAELERVRTEFLAGVSHELRTPAASLVLLAENLADGRVTDDARRAEYYAALRRDAQRLQRLVGDVLDVSRIERGSFEVSREPTDLAPLLRGIAEDQRARLHDVGLDLQVDVPDKLPILPLDGGALERALANLLENARKYAAAGTHVTVEAEVDERGLWIRVEDDGPGVPLEWRERIFERYQRAPSDETLSAGAGLGLTLVRETVFAHGGTVQVEDGASGGARFTLHIPIAGENES
jgi:signal transduction histidine kinase